MARKPQTSSAFSMDAACRLLILAYPAEFRAEFGTEMAQAFRDQCRKMRAQRGMRGLVAFWFDALTDVLLSAPGEQIEVLWRDLRHAVRTLKEQRAARVAVAVLALAIGVASFGYGVVLPNIEEAHAAEKGGGGITALLNVSLWLWFICVHVVSEGVVGAMSRQRRIWLTTAPGIIGRRAVRQILTEGTVLSTLSGTGGLLLAHIAAKVFLSLGPDILPPMKVVAIYPAVLLFTLLSVFVQRKYLKNLLAEIHPGHGSLLALGH